MALYLHHGFLVRCNYLRRYPVVATVVVSVSWKKNYPESVVTFVNLQQKSENEKKKKKKDKGFQCHEVEFLQYHSAS